MRFALFDETVIRVDGAPTIVLATFADAQLRAEAVMARRLATQLDAILEDAAMLAENADLTCHHPKSTQCLAVVEWHSSSGRVSKNSFFDVIEPSSEKNAGV